MGKRIALLILGLALLVLGVLAFFLPELMIWICGLGVIGYGAGVLLRWPDRRRAGTAGGWVLAEGLAAMGAGVGILLGGHLAKLASSILLLILSIWLIAAGVLEVLGAIMYRRAMTSVDLGVQAPGSLSSLIIGLIMVAAGLFGAFHPLFAAFAVGTIVAINIIVTGVRLILSARSGDTILYRTE